MESYLEKIPHDVLQHIAFLCASTSVFEPPSDVLQLLLTTSTIYHSLSVQSCPHLYANIFRTKFDLVAARRRFHYSGLTDSSLAAELVQRCRVLRRIRRGELSGPNLRQDIWTIFWMILESDVLNEAQLATAGFSRFILAFLRTRLRERDLDDSGWPLYDEVGSLALWSYCLTLSRRDITNKHVEFREEILTLLRPFTLRDSAINLSALPSHFPPASPILGSERSLHVHADGPINQPAGTKCKVFHYSRGWTLACPDPSFAAIVLTFALKEAVPLQIPPHLPESRALAIATQRAGPTMEDYHALACCRTPLFADSCPDIPTVRTNLRTYLDISRSMEHDQDFCRMVLEPPGDLIHSQGYSYIPGMLTGIWEGTYMVSPFVSPGSNSPMSPSSGMPDFLCRQPIQCHLSEHLCFSPHIPLPTGDVGDGDASLSWNYSPCRLVPSKDGFEMSSRIFRYQQYTPPPTSAPKVGRDPREALDVVITGETPLEHEEAWGSYRYAGKVRLRDGLITLKRQPKNAGDDGLGSWIFEGYLHFGAAFIGRWRSSTASDRCGIEGIFSMRKRAEA